MTRQSHTGNHGTSDWLMGAVRSNPEGLLLLAAGCALLLRSGAPTGSGKATNRSVQSAGGDQRSSDAHRKERPAGPGISESLSQATESAREYAEDVGKTVGDKAGAYASAVSDKAGAYASAVGEYADDAWRKSERAVGQARTTMQGSISRLLQEQPLALAAAGLAAGAMVAATFPATAVERRTLGPAGERLSEAASSAGQQISQAASKAGERLMNVAEERGLNTQGLKDAASDVAGAFTGAFSGEQPMNPGAPSGTGNQGTGSGQVGKSASSASASNYGSPSSDASQRGVGGGSGSSFGQASGSSDPSKPGNTRQS
jgi:hypothetical protein